VLKAGPKWVERFWRLHEERTARGQMRVLSAATGVTDAREHLPAWVREKPGYGIWERTNLWMLFNALDEACDQKSEDPNMTLIALWDGRASDGPGGTGDLIEKVERLGARTRLLMTEEIFAA
jgi:hypothetical protein